MSDAPRHLSVAAAALLLAACGTTPRPQAPQLAPATPAALRACAELPSQFSFADTTLTAASAVPAGTLKVGGRDVAEHCLVTGRMFERTSPVDGKAYAIGFEMRLPRDWNGRFFHQGNGGLDGFVQPAIGAVSGGGPLTHALHQGFAVLSSDAGHNVGQLPLFGLDPQARLDYGYQAVGKLTPMAKSLIRAAYAKAPDRSYIGGCSNGGRHAMVAASRFADQYDGVLAGNPGFNLPKAAVAQLYGAQQYATLATGPDLATAFSPAERKLVADAVLARCDALDGAADGLVNAGVACQRAFDLARDVPTCAGARDGSCLSARQKQVLANVFGGARNPAGQRVYAGFPFDAGITGADWANWEFVYSVTHRDPVAVAYVFQTPPADAGNGAAKDPKAFALAFDVERDGQKIFASDQTFTESSMAFMTPPDAADLSALKNRGAKLLVYHGTSDAVFSSDDTAAWYDALARHHGGNAAGFARYFPVPGMNHCRGGPATDQFDMLGALVNWVERGQAPDAVVASARGAGNPGGVNNELPATWSPARTRPLCAYPKVATYKGGGDIESADNFICREPKP
jgi:hypothetical protein